ncbi:hypothetical protein [Neobacillus sp. OS1-33]|jgi:hypothetical protein|uniref:hypothetical protein n=1 Tax=Neobacillus sp. OS1-33 TaxID=3070683 RepID=UPI0027DF49F3|nr:hypothetical protein [Neobacillus sp. OS1-33]WML26149.1 hypothetical protein RCG22_00425 [Neobacillus sp. OS1-33]
MNSKERCVLITGTHQFQKHVLALRTVVECANKSNILLRVNAMNNLDTILESNKKFKSGIPYKTGSTNNLYIDTIKSTTWNNNPYNIDYAVLYPLDSVGKSSSQKEIMDDFNIRHVKKIFLVSWTDTHDFSWANKYIDCHVVYDVEEEDPE